MEFILISEDKIKVTLTEAELEEFDLVAEQLDYANTETKRMFWDVLSRAKSRTGFDTDGQKVLVQLYPSRDGGCEIFVTKIGSMYRELGDDPLDSEARPIAMETVSPKRRKKLPAPDRVRYAVYSFSTLEDMIRVCRELERQGYPDESASYISDEQAFYLVLSTHSSPERYPFILEFGEEESSRSAVQILSEHATPIKAERAVSALALC